MKREISFLLIGVAVAAPCFAGLFDDGYFIQLITQGATLIRNGNQLYQLEQQAQQNVLRAAAFIRNPSGWTGAINRSQAALYGASNGSDQVALQRLNLALAASKEVYAQMSSEAPTTQNMAALSMLLNDQARTKNEADQLNTSLQSIGAYQDKVRTDGDWGCVSCSIGAHQQ